MEAGRRRVGGKMRRMKKKKISDMMPEETRSSKRQKARRGWVGGGREKRCDEAHLPLSLRERQPQTCRSGADQTLIRTT